MTTNPKILIVDDKRENLLALKTVLKGLDVDLVEAMSGNDALKATIHHDFALALLDIQMPGMDGYELAGILREEEKTAHLPFIFISAVYTDNLNIFKGYEKGAFSFITKPFQSEILINKVKFFIEKHQQEISLYKMNRELEEKNLELQSMNLDLESFSYSISHDLRAPLRSINGFSALLKEENHDKLDKEANRLLDTIIDSALRMSNLIDSLLNFSRLGKRELLKTSINMNSLVKNIFSDPDIKEKSEGAQVIIQELPDTKGDIELIKQVLVNLISNAIKYSSRKDHPIITIGGEQESTRAVYYVKDNGVGFNMEYKNKLFQVFQRLHKPSDFEGTGIGLAIVQRIITQHGGNVWAEGEVDQGAAFYFSLPS